MSLCTCLYAHIHTHEKDSTDGAVRDLERSNSTLLEERDNAVALVEELKGRMEQNKANATQVPYPKSRLWPLSVKRSQRYVCTVGTVYGMRCTYAMYNMRYTACSAGTQRRYTAQACSAGTQHRHSVQACRAGT